GREAQAASLHVFALPACAVELGLPVPGLERPPLPHKPDYKAPGLALNKAECDALIKYVGDLPAPIELKAEHSKHTRTTSHRAGRSSPPWAAPPATRRSWATWRASTATSCCTTWGRVCP